MSRAVPAVQYVLRVRRQDGTEQTLPLASESVTLGRAGINTVVVADALASRFHARIALEEDGYRITDRGSKNGTQVDGEDVSNHLLEPGQEIRVGDTVLRFDEMTGGPADGETETRLDAADLDGALDGLIGVLDGDESELGVLDDVAARIRRVVACDRASIVLVEEGTQNPLMRFSHGAALTDAPDDQILRAGLAAGAPTSMSVPRSNASADHTVGVSRHALLVPLRNEERKIGLVVLERDPFRAHFGAEDLRLATIAGEHVSAFLRRAL